MPDNPDEITTLREFKSYLSAVRAQAGRKGGKAPAKSPKGFAAQSPEFLTELAYKSHEKARQNRASRKPPKPAAS